ncbi:hypothetical protein [Nodosilinea nodulosa]|uniref:hypothetical protein n=1 Tax=Nodosilinea nodulosa TaxID=416001 RepID=UPI0002F63238|nr:hypothetical protein [Nodosilinea nodulosa]
MLSESFKQFVKAVSGAAGLVLTGALLALVLSGFQGYLEMELKDGGGSFRIVGPGGTCEMLGRD